MSFWQSGFWAHGFWSPGFWGEELDRRTEYGGAAYEEAVRKHWEYIESLRDIEKKGEARREEHEFIVARVHDDMVGMREIEIPLHIPLPQRISEMLPPGKKTEIEMRFGVPIEKIAVRDILYDDVTLAALAIIIAEEM